MTHPLYTILTEAAYHKLGIVPIKDVILDVNRILADLPPDEARAMRRKFRKLWRTLAKRAAAAGAATGKKSSITAAVQMGLGERNPTRYSRRNRKHAVRTLIRDRVVVPALDGGEKP